MDGGRDVMDTGCVIMDSGRDLRYVGGVVTRVWLW